MNDPTGDRDGEVEIRLVGFPVTLYHRLQQHSDELLREFELISQSFERDPGRHVEIPGRLLAVIEELRRAYSPAGAEPEAQIDAALAARAERLDEVVYRLPTHVGAAAAQLGALLDEADRYCRAGEHLLTLAIDPELKRFRDWYIGEFTRQAAGLPPAAWTD